MNVSVTFYDTKITPLRYGGGTNEHTIPCQSMMYIEGRVRIDFSPHDLQKKSVQVVIANRRLSSYGDSSNKYIEIPCKELYAAKCSN